MIYSKKQFLHIAFALFGFLVLNAANTFAQNNASVKGTITDAQNKPLAGVNIAVTKLNKGASSKKNGSYKIENLPAGTHTLVFSFVGYQSLQQNISLDKNETLNLDIMLKQQRLESGTITVTGTPYASDPLTTPADVDVLSGNAKFAQQQTSLGASLEELAGISTISTGSQVGKPVIRGLSGNRVRVLDDGIAMDFQQYGVRHGPNVDPFTSERIEVVRGAASVQYGSDALGGAINVISNSIPEAINNDPFLDGQALGTYASNNEEWSGGLHLDGASGGWGFTGTLVRRSAGNITVPDVPNFEESGDNTGPKFTDELNHTDYDQLNGSVGLGYQGGFNNNEISDIPDGNWDFVKSIVNNKPSSNPNLALRGKKTFEVMNKYGFSDEIIVTELEHHSNYVPWHYLRKKKGAAIKFASVNENGEIDIDEFKKNITEKTKMIAFTHISNVTGTILPIKKVTDLAKSKNIPVLIDGTQGAPHSVLDVRDLGCDFYAISCHKMYGPN